MCSEGQVEIVRPGKRDSNDFRICIRDSSLIRLCNRAVASFNIANSIDMFSSLDRNAHLQDMADLAASSKDNSRNRTPSTASTPSDPSTLPPRPKLHPAPFPYNPSPSSLLSSSSKAAPSEHPKWTPVISCPAYFPLEVYEKTIQEFCLLPERNSTCILRADILEDVEVIEKLSDEIEMENLELEGMDLRSDTKHEHPQEVKGGSWIPFRKLRLNLLPRKPGVDKPLEQECLFLQRRRRSPDTSLSQNDGNALGTAEQEEQEDSVIQDSMVIMSPLVEKEQDVPFYHPPVRKLAIRWTRISQDPTLSAPKTGLTDVHTDQEGSSKPKRYGTLSLSILPFQTFPIPASLKSHDDLKTSDVLPNRLYRTCLSLMEMIGKVGWGKMVGYQKRVLTDVSSSSQKSFTSAERRCVVGRASGCLAKSEPFSTLFSKFRSSDSMMGTTDDHR